jgi:hypothetical protein
MGASAMFSMLRKLRSTLEEQTSIKPTPIRQHSASQPTARADMIIYLQRTKMLEVRERSVATDSEGRSLGTDAHQLQAVGQKRLDEFVTKVVREDKHWDSSDCKVPPSHLVTAQELTALGKKAAAVRPQHARTALSSFKRWRTNRLISSAQIHPCRRLRSYRPPQWRRLGRKRRQPSARTRRLLSVRWFGRRTTFTRTVRTRRCVCHSGCG